MPLSNKRRSQLDGIVDQMVRNKEKDDDVRLLVEDFKSKYENEQDDQPVTSQSGGQAGGMGDLKYEESQAKPLPLESNPIFPATVQEYSKRFYKPAGSISQSFKDFGAVGLAGLADIGSYESRLWGTATGKTGMDDAQGGYFKDRRMADDADFDTRIAKAIQEHDADPSVLNHAKVRGLQALKIGRGVLTGVEESPVTSFGSLAVKGVANVAPKVLGALGKGVAGLNRGAGRLASTLSGVPEESLRAYGNIAERAKMAANYGREQEIGSDLLHHIDNPDQFLPEKMIVDDALDKMGPINMQSALDAMHNAKGRSVAGRISPEKAAANTGIDKYIDFLRGGPVPEDLANSSMNAGRKFDGARSELAIAKNQATKDIKAASQADRAQSSAQAAAAKAASKAGSTKKEFIQLSDQADKNSLRWGGARNEAGQTAESALEEAQAAAAKSRQISADARASLAVGDISKADFEAAQAAEMAADHNLIVTETARKLFNGQPIKDVAQELSSVRGMNVNDLRDVLTKARDKARGIGELPGQTVSARDYRSLRRDIDVPVKWDDEGAGIKSNALLAGRTTMKNELIQKAMESGNQGYVDAMKSWANKLDKLDQIKSMLGKNATTRDKRVQSFVANLFGKNHAYKEELMKDLDEVFQSDIVGRAKSANMAAALGEDGIPSLMPRQVTGASLKAGLLANLIPGAGQVAAIATASPRIAATITLPMLSKLETSLKAAGIGMTPKAANALNALKKATTEAQKVRLASILASELELQIPENAIPFRQKVADRDSVDDQQFVRR